MALSVVIPPLKSVRLVGPRASDYCCCKNGLIKVSNSELLDAYRLQGNQ